jgi:hypothetical protein
MSFLGTAVRRNRRAAWLAAALGCAAVGTMAGTEAVALTNRLHAALRAANPQYAGGGTFRVRDGKLVMISLMRCPGITDLTPLQDFPLESVSSLNLYNAVNVADLSPLRACRLTSVNLERCAKVRDLSPLAGMPIRWLRMYACPGVSDLSPLKGMPLQHLDMGKNPRIRDLSVLAGMPLRDLRMDECPAVRDISILRGLPLTFLSLFGCMGIEEYSALEGLELETLYFSPGLLSEADIRTVRNMESLRKIGTSWADYRKELSPDAFWQRYDAGEFRSVAP